jgi:beta-N-acetylhexosaminidase
MPKLNNDFLQTIVLLTIILVLLFFNWTLSKAESESSEIKDPTNVLFDKSTNTLQLDSLTLKQKIAQMIVTNGDENAKDELQKMLIGGIYFGAKPSKESYIDSIKNFQDGAVIPFFVTIDLEGCWNPFENFQKFPTLKEIKTKEDAYQVGFDEGKLLKELGFSIDFSPVVDLNDTIWNCRSFTGTPEEIAEKANFYIKGLQENGILATSKHYPGKTLSIRDPHQYITYATIDDSDLMPFKKTIGNNVSAIMISHVIVNGLVDSESKPSVVSQKLVSGLRNQFAGLIVTDEVHMLGLDKYYTDADRMYVDLFKADNDLVLYFDANPKDLYHMISIVEDAVKRGDISEKRIDDSVTRILGAKGIQVV